MTIAATQLGQAFATRRIMQSSSSPDIYGRLENNSAVIEARKTHGIGVKFIVSIGLGILFAATRSVPAGILVGLSSYFLLRVLEVFTNSGHDSPSFFERMNPSIIWRTAARGLERFASALPSDPMRYSSERFSDVPTQPHATFGSRAFGEQPSPDHSLPTSTAPHATFGSRAFGGQPSPDYDRPTSPVPSAPPVTFGWRASDTPQFPSYRPTHATFGSRRMSS